MARDFRTIVVIVKVHRAREDDRSSPKDSARRRASRLFGQLGDRVWGFFDTRGFGVRSARPWWDRNRISGRTSAGLVMPRAIAWPASRAGGSNGPRRRFGVLGRGRGPYAGRPRDGDG